MAKTITYQGERIQAVHVTEINTVHGEGADTLYRDQEGAYFLERDRTFVPADEQPESPHVRPGFHRVHRVNVNAAILWAIGLAGDHGPLRRDAADLLMQVPGRGGYEDPWPADSYPEIKAARDAHSSEAWVAEVLAGRADQIVYGPSSSPRPAGHRSDEPQRVACPLLLPLSARQHAMLCQAAKHDEAADPAAWVMGLLGDTVALTLAQAHGHDERLAYLGWHSSGQPTQPSALNPGVPVEEGLTVHLDARAAAMVNELRAASPFDHSVDDIASGCVNLLLSLALDNLPEAQRLSGLDKPGYHDGDWGSAMRAITEAHEWRMEQPVNAPEEPAPFILPRGHQTARHRRDVALAAAATPEPVHLDPDEGRIPEADEDLVEEEHQDEEEGK